VLDRLVSLFRDYEHNPKMTVKGVEIDKLIKDSDDYLKRLEGLREDIEKKSNEKTIEQAHMDIFRLLEAIIGKKPQKTLVEEFDKLVKEGKFTHQHSRILKDVVGAKAEFKKKKMKPHEIDKVRKNGSILISELLEYSQRAELMALEKSRMRVRYKDKGQIKVAEILHTNGASFLFLGSEVKKLTNKIEASTMQEVSAHIESQKGQKSLEINPKIFDLVKKELGDFEILLK
jgi:hypothetical protein